MAAFDFDSALRLCRKAPALARRDDEDLPFIDKVEIAGAPLLLDACVYIDQMQGRAPARVEAMIAARLVNHSTVALQELMHTVGVLDPADRRTAGVIKIIRAQIEAMRPHRVFAPDADVLGQAAALSGLLCRLRGFAGDSKLRMLMDCMLFLQAAKLGLTVLTANLNDFDLLLQMVPSGRALFYRRS